MPCEISEISTEKVQTAKKLCMGLQSSDKRVRKQAFIALQSFLSNPTEDFPNQDLRSIFTETYMYTLSGFRDNAETVREQAIKFMWFFIIDKLPLNDFYLTYVLPVIVERIGTVELIEESEEIRLQLVTFLQAIILKYSNTEHLKPFLGDCVIILAESVKDKHPQIKETSCRCIINLANALPQTFHMQAENLVKPVITCFGHQRYKVRLEAIRAMGDIIMHSSYNGLNEAVGPMAERLFDQIPAVRRAVAQVAARWLREYRDRYSFFQKIMPLLLTGLNDEVEETRLEAHQLWEQVGLQYQKENEKDLKDQMDYLLDLPKYYPDNLKRPNLGCRVLVQRNVSKLTKALSMELMSWQEDIRVRCSQLLCAITLHAEEGLTQNLQDLLPAMYSAAKDDDGRVVSNIVRASEIMGVFIPVKTWSKLVLPAVEDGAHWGHFAVLAGLITGTPKEYIENSLEEIAKILADDSICLTRKKKAQVEIAKCAKAIWLKCSEKSGDQVGFYLFKIIVALISLRDLDNSTIITSTLLDELYKVLRMPDCYTLWSRYVDLLLRHISVDPRAWTVVTPQRCIFETILLETNEAFGENLELIGRILVEALDPAADAEARLKTFWALSSAFERKDVIFSKAKNLKDFYQLLITEVFVPSLVWHAGLTAEALRTMAASCLVCALSPTAAVDLFSDPQILRELFDKLLPLLLSLMEDASYRSRFLSIECVGLLKIHACAKGIWNVDDLIKIYSDILKRLDDPTDKVRVTALKILPEILSGVPAEFKELHFKAHHELIIDTLLIHFDDYEEEIRQLVYDVLKTVAAVNSEELFSKIHKHKPLVRNQKGCEDILEYLEHLKLS